MARREDNFAVRYTGYFRVREGGEYRFTLSSDDGSKLYVDGKQVVDNDGVHSTSQATGTVKLAPGIHQVEVAYFQGGGEAGQDLPHPAEIKAAQFLAWPAHDVEFDRESRLDQRGAPFARRRADQQFAPHRER